MSSNRDYTNCTPEQARCTRARPDIVSRHPRRPGNLSCSKNLKLKMIIICPWAGRIPQGNPHIVSSCYASKHEAQVFALITKVKVWVIHDARLYTYMRCEIKRNLGTSSFCSFYVIDLDTYCFYVTIPYAPRLKYIIRSVNTFCLRRCPTSVNQSINFVPKLASGRTKFN